MSVEPPSTPGPEVGPSAPGGTGASARPGVSRRGLLGAAGAAGVVGVGAGLVAGRQLGGPGSAVAEPAPAPDRYPFLGEHQAGIVTPAQDRLHFAAFDMVSSERADLISLLQDWTAAAARMTQGHDAGPFGATSGPYDAPPDDTGEALGLPPARLTLTFGFGPTLFRLAGQDRFGLAARQPAALQRLPHFPGDHLDPQRSDGDLCVQACADDPQVAVHAIRNLARIAMGRASLRWSQLGFGRTSSTSTSQATPRNLFGFKDGTMNLKAEEPDLLDTHVWVRPDGAADRWLAGGSYLVARRINMTIETWDRQPLREQERVIGRTKAEGAPLSGGSEFSQPDFALQGRGAQPLVAPDAHIRLVHPDQNQGAQMLRRGYNFVDGSNGLGRMDAGLFFIAYVSDPRTHYIPMQMKIARGDGMSEYLQHTGSGLFAVPPGVTPGGYLGQPLFAA
ncbi:deferrochelatase/peroxidase EfeB [Friedmanniella luteola]|uniref:Deferrochelatase n=1 Tax=Friedmanniella luteola TaxID=546871 RepID=A0A1H1L1K5_9ACTN|nr:iron uptake transporter deferrochelatase/peroxidase subunit [Friedmanniella luteola]SDR68461.1 deferrochelatase/peroxidase EfeB [Friedmanniella luteola]